MIVLPITTLATIALAILYIASITIAVSFVPDAIAITISFDPNAIPVAVAPAVAIVLTSKDDGRRGQKKQQR